MLVAMNDFILVKLIKETVSESGFVLTEEAKGEGTIVRCTVVDCKQQNEAIMNKTIFVPQYAIRQVKDDIWACSSKSIIAYEQ